MYSVQRRISDGTDNCTNKKLKDAQAQNYKQRLPLSFLSLNCWLYWITESLGFNQGYPPSPSSLWTESTLWIPQSSPAGATALWGISSHSSAVIYLMDRWTRISLAYIHSRWDGSPNMGSINNCSDQVAKWSCGKIITWSILIRWLCGSVTMMQELVVLLLTGNYSPAIILVVILAQLACRDKSGGINNQEDVRKAVFSCLSTTMWFWSRFHKDKSGMASTQGPKKCCFRPWGFPTFQISIQL